MMFIIGTGSTLAFGPPRYLYRGTPSWAAAALATAMETARMALAPRTFFVELPSSASMAASIGAWCVAHRPRIAGAILPFTFSTALRTPLPRKRPLSPSRSSTASFSPVEAPEGTEARPEAPPSRRTSTSTVGLPRESITSRPRISTMVVLLMMVDMERLDWVRRPLPGRILSRLESGGLRYRLISIGPPGHAADPWIHGSRLDLVVETLDWDGFGFSSTSETSWKLAGGANHRSRGKNTIAPRQGRGRNARRQF